MPIFMIFLCAKFQNLDLGLDYKKKLQTGIAFTVQVCEWTLENVDLDQIYICCFLYSFYRLVQ